MLKLKIAFYLILTLYMSIINAKDVGIYINQGTLEDNQKINFMITQAKNTGINTFVVDLKFVTNNYQSQIAKIKANDIKYVARIVVFPGGGQAYQIKSPFYWEKIYSLVEKAIVYGADAIQLDYIRYSTKQKASRENAQDILKVIDWFKNKVKEHNVDLQIDVFGEASFKESPRIGQNVKLFAHSVDTVCPMVYPSHYKPYKVHFKTPYQTIYSSMMALKSQFPEGKPPFKLIPYIEATNFRYKMSFNHRVEYIKQQIKATQDAHTDGFYVWSANNIYGALFEALRQMSKE